MGVDLEPFLNATKYGSDADIACRAAWKYGAYRGVYGTPSFLLNSVPVNADPGWSIADWCALFSVIKLLYFIQGQSYRSFAP